MSFGQLDMNSQNEEEQKRILEERRRRKEQRANAMFGNAGTGRSGAVYPLNEKVNLPVDLIDENPDNENIFNMDFIEELSQNIKNKGFHGVVEVFQKDDGRFELVAGHRRFRAAKLKGLKVIPAVIEPMPDEITKAERLLSSNILNRNLTPLDYARAVAYYIEHVLVPSGFKGDKYQACADFFLKSKTNIKRYMAITAMIPELQALAGEPSFPYTAFDSARTLSPEEQRVLYNEILAFKKSNPDIEISRIYVEQSINAIKKRKEQETQFNQNKQSAANHLHNGKNNTSEETKASEKKKDVSEQFKFEQAKEDEDEVVVSSKRSKTPSVVPIIKTIEFRLGEIKPETIEENERPLVKKQLSELNDIINKLLLELE